MLTAILNFLAQVIAQSLRGWADAVQARKDGFDSGARAAELNANKEDLTNLQKAHDNEERIRDLPLSDLREQLRRTNPAASAGTKDNG